jgi:hypothetical protein
MPFPGFEERSNQPAFQHSSSSRCQRLLDPNAPMPQATSRVERQGDAWHPLVSRQPSLQMLHNVPLNAAADL